MKTFRMIGATLVAAVIAFAMNSCEKDGKEDYKDYPQLIVGKWFNFTPTESVFMNFNDDKTVSTIGYDKVLGWMENTGTYRIEEDKIIRTYLIEGSPLEVSTKIEVTNDRFIFKAGSDSYNPELGDRVHYRVQEQFDIKGNYSYLNSAVRVVPAEGKTALQLPEGVLFQGQNYIPVDAMHGDRIIDVMKKFFADATFAADGKLNHTLEGEAKVKNYTLAQNVTANIIMTDNRVKETFSTELGVTIIVYSKQYKDETGMVKKFYPDGMATLIPDKALGNTWYGMTPEERTLLGRPDADVAIVDGGVAVSVTVTEDPVQTKTTVSEISGNEEAKRIIQECMDMYKEEG